ncbi:MAG: ABC transporter permease, partial [Eubacteriales bacterium]|nr:ABC transporter permease [Eubacteriales bacterium]
SEDGSGGRSGDGSGSENEGGSGGAPDVSAVLAALDTMEETIIDKAVESAADEAVAPLQSTIDALNNAKSKEEADAVIDGLDLDDTQKAGLKAMIKKQFEEGGKESTKKYITLAYLDAYKEKAITLENVKTMTEKIDKIKIDPEHALTIIEESFDNYYGSLKPDETGMVPVKSLPSTEEAINKAVRDNSELLFEEGYQLAKEYMALLVAKGTGEAVAEVMKPLANLFSGSEDLLTIDTDKFAEAFTFDKDEDELARIMTAMLTGGKTTYTNNLLKLGYQKADEPSSISFYFYDFEAKNAFSDFLTAYNDAAPEKQKLNYTDITGILMGSVETIVNAVTYVLIAFVSISLIVSSIMIGIITYISVLERTKEIGILRAIGASKRNISTIFNAETFIIGFLSGVIGVVVTRLLLFPINTVIHKVTKIDDITAVLSLPAALVLVLIATLLTMFGGLIPSSSASKKDPVIALRTE